MYREMLAHEMNSFTKRTGIHPNAAVIDKQVYKCLEKECLDNQLSSYLELLYQNNKEPIKKYMGIELIEGTGNELFYFFKK